MFTANPDPTAVIAGDRFSSVKGEDLSTYRYMQEIMKEGDSEEDTEQKRITLKLVIHIQKQDVDLLQSYSEAISGYAHSLIDINSNCVLHIFLML